MKRPVSKEAETAANLIMWALLILVLGSLLGLWIKFFWLGFVFAGCLG